MKKSKVKNSKLLPNSLRIISSCIKTVSTNASTAVRSAGASVAASISSVTDDRKEQVLWAGFDKLELSPTAFRRVLLLGYVKGFQVFDVEDASGLSELVSRRDGPVSFLQMLPVPPNRDGTEKHNLSHPILVVVGGEEDDRNTVFQNARQGPVRYGSAEASFESTFDPPAAVRFYSMKSNDYVKVIDFKSAVLMVRCSARVVAIGLEEQIYCFDTITLEQKFVVITYPVPRVGDQGAFGINTGYGPLAVGPRWLAYPPYRPFLLNTGRVSPQNLASSVSPSSSPGSSTLMRRFAVESSKHLAAGILNLGDMGYKKLSKHYPELLHDSPSSPGRKSSRLAASESENAGWIAVKDLVSSEVISQFRAHSSPISALCFDPSGTLLVTASVCGNNINIFRIMPSHSTSGSGNNDWSSSYAHLYKLHRGVTTAVIQDICFSQYSQWIAVVSSRGTCHVFVLSPFGGDDRLQALTTCGQGTGLFLAANQPWWSSPSFTANEQNFTPPPPCNPSVITRIKCSDSGLFNTVSNAAASVAGKIWVPSGAIAAIFHNSNSIGSSDVNSAVKPLEHILVLTPSGFVVQHEIQLFGVEWNGNRTESRQVPQVNSQNEEMRVKVEPIQWWDVCRRLDNLEREECISGNMFDGLVKSDFEIGEDVNDEKKKLVKSDSFKPTEKNQHLSKAEVQVDSCRVPLWQNSKIHFHFMEPPKAEGHVVEEFEIERTPSHEIEIRQKNLLPALHFTSARTGLINRSSIPAEGNYAGDSSQTRQKTNEASVVFHSDPPSFSSTESSEGGSSRRMDGILDLGHMNIGSRKGSPMDQRSRPIGPNVSSVVYKTTISRSCPSGYAILLPRVGITNMASDNIIFNQGYCNEPEMMQDHQKPTEVVTNEADTNDQEENPDDEGWMGGMFDFSEEG